MKAINLIFIVALAIARTTSAQVPSGNDTSDQYSNTGMGSLSLHSVTPSTCTADSNGDFVGCYNTASGYEALYLETTGWGNSAFGAEALLNNTTGSRNTASGTSALAYNHVGTNNTGVGFEAVQGSGSSQTPATASNNTGVGSRTLYSYTSGGNNSALGFNALYYNTTGYNNTASGGFALVSNTEGFDNTASGNNALNSNTIGNYNAAVGVNALYSNVSGVSNSAFGVNALQSNTAGNNLSSIGVNSLQLNTTGNNNTASGYAALHNNTTGSSNIAIGFQAGYHITGSNNIDIGNQGNAADTGFIRIGAASTQTAAFIAGISSSKITGNAVYVTTGGRLGVLASSERFKTAVAPMGSNTAKLDQLRPVTFHLKADPKGKLQYGLIAEEVAKVYPELVIRDEKGRIDGVRYDELAPMLVNEVQHQSAEVRDLKQQVEELKALSQATQVALKTLQAKGALVAER